MYFPDLSPYQYLGREPDPNMLTVGWLDADHDFPKGTVSAAILERILALCFKPVHSTRGIHQSPFIRGNPKELFSAYAVEYKGKRMSLGNAEIRVSARNGKIYAAPNLIYHYIKDCGYLPPQEFLEALMIDQ
jgi:hypothetical protein